MKNLIRKILKEEIENKKYIVYHSSNQTFTKFNSNKITNIKGDLYGKGFYFTDNIEYSKKFGNILYKCEIVLKNPLDLTKQKGKEQLMFLKNTITHFENNDEEYILGSINDGSVTTAFRKLRKYIPFTTLSKYYDGVIGYGEEGGKEYVVYDENNINIVEINDNLNYRPY